MKKNLKPGLTQEQMNRLVRQLLKAYKQFNVELGKAEKGKKKGPVEEPVYTAVEYIKRCWIPMFIMTEAVEKWAKEDDYKWSGKLKAAGDLFTEEMIKKVVEGAVEVNAPMFILSDSSAVVNIDDLGDDDEDAA